MAEQLDWEALRQAFITDPARPNLIDFGVTHGIKHGTLKNRSSREKWMTLRDRHWAQVTQQAAPVIAEMQVAVTARDTAQKLAQIQAMKMTALKYAGGIEGQDVAYEKPHEAVAAYERLEKLERLILGESTEIIKVEDARQMVLAVIQVVREEVRDGDTAERIAARLANLGNAGTGGAEPQPNALA